MVELGYKKEIETSGVTFDEGIPFSDSRKCE